jgi:alpha-beta hydrolase superfamily lysophospholipase
MTRILAAPFASCLLRLRGLGVGLLGLGLLGACSPIVQQQPMRPPASFAGPAVGGDRFISFDGAPLGLSHWAAKGGEPRVVIVGVHGMDDYANTFWTAAPWWAERGVETWAYDQRGFGRSPQRGVWGSQALMTEDLRTLCALLRKRHPHAVLAVVGESMGGAVTIDAFASDRPPDADRVVVLAPAVWGWSNQPPLNKALLWVGVKLFGAQPVEAPDIVVDHIQASDNLPELRRMGRDPLMIWGTRPDTLYGLMNLMEAANREAGRVRTPMLYLYGAHDQIIPPDATRMAVARLGPEIRTGYYTEGWHLLLRDYQAETVWRDVLSFIDDPSAPLPSGVKPIPLKTPKKIKE